MSRETTFTADDVAAAFRAGLELGRRVQPAHTAPDSFAAGLVEGYARAWGHVPADGGLVEDATARAALRLVTEDQVNDILDGGPAPTGLDPETIAAARRIALRLNGGPR